MTGIYLDSSGLGGTEKRRALHRMQGGRCAVCGASSKLVADHDHLTGLLRGLLCRSCNAREGAMQSLLLSADCPNISAYLDQPPAGCEWMWDLPDWWTRADSAEVERRDITILEYVRARA